MQSPHYRDRDPGARNEALTAGCAPSSAANPQFPPAPRRRPPAPLKIKTHIEDIMFGRCLVFVPGSLGEPCLQAMPRGGCADRHTGQTDKQTGLWITNKR